MLSQNFSLISVSLILFVFTGPLWALSTSTQYISLFESSKLDPEVYQNALSIISSKGYKGEEHSITTDDGYILGIQRILPKIITYPQKVVLLQHGLLDSSHTWINNLANQSLGFILSDLGYDVWLGNSRGSTYSRNHKVFDSSMLEFWDFSYDEISKFDLPATIKYIKKHTSVEKIFYVGHSQGTQIAFARFNEDPELQKSIHAFAALAPVAYVKHVQGPLGFISRFPSFIKTTKAIMEWFGSGMFLPSNSLMQYLNIIFCHHSDMPSLCGNVIFLIAGFDSANINMSRVPVYVAHAPAGTSVRNMLHHCQGVISDRFAHFDYGAKGNLLHYGTLDSPSYVLNRLTIPTAIYHGGHDLLATQEDVTRLLDELDPQSVKEVTYIPTYNHLDFVWGLNAAEKVYAKLSSFFASIYP